MDDVRLEFGKVAADFGRKSKRHAIFGPRRDRRRRHGHHFADRIEGGIFDRRRINPNVSALAKHIVNQPVQRLVRAIPHIIVIARKEGDSKIARLHRGQH
jgi:hypothetical protein